MVATDSLGAMIVTIRTKYDRTRYTTILPPRVLTHHTKVRTVREMLKNVGRDNIVDTLKSLTYASAH